MLLHLGRVALLIAREKAKPKLELTAEVRWVGRAWPWHCDGNLHVNNAEFARLLEYGRWVWVVRTGVLARIRKLRGNLVVAGSSQLFRRELRMLRSFEVRTRLSGVDARSTVFDQSIWTPAGKLLCHSYQRMLVIGPDGIRPPASLTEDRVPVLDDDAIQSWLDSQSTILAREKAGALSAVHAGEA